MENYTKHFGLKSMNRALITLFSLILYTLFASAQVQQQVSKLKFTNQIPQLRDSMQNKMEKKREREREEYYEKTDKEIQEKIKKQIKKELNKSIQKKQRVSGATTKSSIYKTTSPNPVGISKKKDKAVNDPLLEEIKKKQEQEKETWMKEQQEKIQEKIRKELQRKSINITNSLNGAASMLPLPDSLEYSALMDFYYATGGPNWTDNTGWSDADPNVVQSVQGWHGVTVDTLGHVVGLGLSTGLIGTIPPSVGNLVNLKY